MVVNKKHRVLALRDLAIYGTEGSQEIQPPTLEIMTDCDWCYGTNKLSSVTDTEGISFGESEDSGHASELSPKEHRAQEESWEVPSSPAWACSTAGTPRRTRTQLETSEWGEEKEKSLLKKLAGTRPHSLGRPGRKFGLSSKKKKNQSKKKIFKQATKLAS